MISVTWYTAATHFCQIKPEQTRKWDSRGAFELLFTVAEQPIDSIFAKLGTFERVVCERQRMCNQMVGRGGETTSSKLYITFPPIVSR